MENRLSIANIDNKEIKEATIDINGKKYVYINRKDIPKNAEYVDVFILDGCNYGLIRLNTRDRLRRLLYQRG